jgi:penicillin-binding protein 1A
MATTSTPKRPATPGGGTRGPTDPPSRTSGNGQKRRRPRKRSVWQKIGSFFLYLTLIIVIFVAVAAASILYQLGQLPPVRIEFNPAGRTLIYSSDGELLAKLFTENRQVVPLEQIPKYLQQATVAFEDRRFYEHQGVDFHGIMRALTRNLKHGDMKGEGASTITQQLARNVGAGGVTREKSISRKIKEWIVANQIEHAYTKDRILEMYLNQVNYGSGAYGVEAAAQTYFGKHVKDLDLAQCALLAGLPNRPSFYTPYKGKKNAELQRNRVLDEMLKEKYITPEQAASAKTEYIHLAARKAPPNGNVILHAPYFVN